VLPSGKVLVTGGFNGALGQLASAELYDPATGSWSATGSMLAPREAQTATLLPSGKVLVTGGALFVRRERAFQVLVSAEIYDPATGRWSLAGQMSSARAYHTATLLPSGKVLVAGGVRAFSATGAPTACASCRTTTATMVFVVLPMIHGVAGSIGAPPGLGVAAPAVTVTDAPAGSRTASTAPGNSRRARWRSRICAARVASWPVGPGSAAVARPAPTAPTARRRSRRNVDRCRRDREPRHIGGALPEDPGDHRPGLTSHLGEERQTVGLRRQAVAGRRRPSGYLSRKEKGPET
jgi:hypothetical protein